MTEGNNSVWKTGWRAPQNHNNLLSIRITDRKIIIPPNQGNWLKEITHCFYQDCRSRKRKLSTEPPACEVAVSISRPRCISLESHNSRTITSFSKSGEILVIVTQQVPAQRTDCLTASAIYNAVAIQSTSKSCRSNQFPSQAAGLHKSFFPRCQLPDAWGNETSCSLQTTLVIYEVWQLTKLIY
jgi:hypothetical protein